MNHSYIFLEKKTNNQQACLYPKNITTPIKCDSFFENNNIPLFKTHGLSPM